MSMISALMGGWACLVLSVAAPGSDMTVAVGEFVVISKSDQTRYWLPGVMQMDSSTLIVSIARSPDEINPDATQPVYTCSKDGPFFRWVCLSQVVKHQGGMEPRTAPAPGT